MSPLARQALNPFSRRNRPFTLYLMLAAAIALAWYSGEEPRRAAEQKQKARARNSRHAEADIPTLRNRLTSLTNQIFHLEAKRPLLQDARLAPGFAKAWEEVVYQPGFYPLYQKARDRGNELVARRLPRLRAAMLFQQGYQDELAAQQTIADAGKRAEARAALDARCQAGLTNGAYAEDLKLLEGCRLWCAGDPELDSANEDYRAALWREVTSRHPDLRPFVAQAQQAWREGQAAMREANEISRELARHRDRAVLGLEQDREDLPAEAQQKLAAIAQSRLTEQQKLYYSRAVVGQAQVARLTAPPSQTNAHPSPEKQLWQRITRFFAREPGGAQPTRLPGRSGARELQLKMISYSPKLKLATINDATLAPGESAQIQLAKGTVKVECLEVTAQSATVRVDGGAPATLHL
jgi:hypothetical protein